MDSLFEKISNKEEQGIMRLAVLLSLALLVLISLDVSRDDGNKECCTTCGIEIKVAPKAHRLYNKFCSRWYKISEPFYIKGHFSKINRQIGWRVKVSKRKEIFYLCEEKYLDLLRGTHPARRSFQSKALLLDFIKKVPDCY